MQSVICLHAQVISTVVESVFPVSLPPPARAGPGRADLYRRRVRLSRLSPSAGPGRAGPRRAGRSLSNDLILVVPYYSRRLPTGRHETAGNFVETGLKRNSRFPQLGNYRRSDFVVFGRASERDRRQGFGAHDRAGLRHATGGRSPPARAGPRRAGPRRAVTGARPGFGTRPAASLRRTRPGRASECDQQLLPRRRIGICRRFPRFLQLRRTVRGRLDLAGQVSARRLLN